MTQQMPNTMQNLWLDNIAQVDTVAPVTILKQQAKVLGQKTKNIVHAKVYPMLNTPPDVRFSFNLEATALNYSYPLFTISHNSMDFYPMRFESEYGKVEITNEQELIEKLREIFAKEKTQKVIGSLLAQSEA